MFQHLQLMSPDAGGAGAVCGGLCTICVRCDRISFQHLQCERIFLSFSTPTAMSLTRARATKRARDAKSRTQRPDKLFLHEIGIDRACVGLNLHDRLPAVHDHKVGVRNIPGAAVDKTDQDITLSHLEWDPEFRSSSWRVTG